MHYRILTKSRPYKLYGFLCSPMDGVRSAWSEATNIPEEVTCPKCLELMEENQ